MRSLGDAGGLHLPLSARFQNANLKVSVDHPKRVFSTFGKLEVQFRGFIIKGSAVMAKAVFIAVNTIDMVSSDLPEPYARGAIASRESSMNARAASRDLNGFAGLMTIACISGCIGSSKQQDACQ